MCILVIKERKGQKRGEQQPSSRKDVQGSRASRSLWEHRGRSLAFWAMLSVQNTNEKSFKSLTITQKSEVRQILSEATAAN